ncbi:MAG: DUF3794 domain-containing protein [Clostridia bacterium]|nr:DUF3794 domain-containing protein [Clostridia bacterium]
MDNKTIHCRSALRTFHGEILAEQDFIVPDIKPDIQKVLKLTAVPVLHQADAGQGRLSVSGDLLLYLCYLPEEGTTARAMELRLPFSDVFDIGACDVCLPEVSVLRTACNLLNGRKVNVRVTLSVHCTLQSHQKVQLLCPEEEENLRILTKPFSYCETVSVADRTVEFLEQLELPAHSAPIRELLSVEPTVILQEYQAINERIAVTGVVRGETLYLPDTDPCSVARMEHELPFTEVLHADDLREGSYCHLSVLPNRFEVGLLEDSDGDACLLSLRFSFRLAADACNQETCETVADAFGLNTPVTLQTDTHRTVCTCQQEVLSQNIRQMLPARGVLEVCSLTATPRMTDCTVEQGAITHSGELSVSALLLCEPDGGAESFYATVPFSITQESGALSKEQVTASPLCEHAGYTLQPDGGLELRATLKLAVTTVCCEEHTLVTELLPCEEATPKESRMVIYFTQEGDSLWNIAKRYGSCPKKIAALNHLTEDDNLTPHVALLIP